MLPATHSCSSVPMLVLFVLCSWSQRKQQNFETTELCFCSKPIQSNARLLLLSCCNILLFCSDVFCSPLVFYSQPLIGFGFKNKPSTSTNNDVLKRFLKTTSHVPTISQALHFLTCVLPQNDSRMWCDIFAIMWYFCDFFVRATGKFRIS